ncbi:hypothetical protein MTO96_048368 [Rhipicephalus appendiculatus]
MKTAARENCVEVKRRVNPGKSGGDPVLMLTCLASLFWHAALGTTAGPALLHNNLVAFGDEFHNVGSGEFYYCPEMEAERLRASSEESCDEESGSDEQQPLESVTYREAGDHCQRLHSKKMISLPSNAIYCTDAERPEATVAFIGSPDSTPPGEDAVAAGSVNGRLEAPADQPACPARHGTVRHGLRQSSRRSVRRRDHRRQKRPSLMARRRMSSQIQELWINSVSKVDRASRVVFPLAFIVVNTVYWLTYFREDEDS